MVDREFSYVWTFYWKDGTISSANAPFGPEGRIDRNDSWLNRFNAEYPFYWKELGGKDKELDYIEVVPGEVLIDEYS